MTTPRLNGGTSTPGVALTRTERRPAGDNRSPRVGRYGSTDPDASQRRWRIRKETSATEGSWWEVTDPDCHDLGRACRCAAFDTWDAAVDDVRAKLCADAVRETWETMRHAATEAWDAIRAAFMPAFEAVRAAWAALAEPAPSDRFPSWDDIVNDTGWPTPEALYPDEDRP